MTIHALILPGQFPENGSGIKVDMDFGQVSIITSDNNYVTGTHAVLQGETESMKAYIKSIDGIWLGKGSPMMQEFEFVPAELIAK